MRARLTLVTVTLAHHQPMMMAATLWLFIAQRADEKKSAKDECFAL
jgi:hypothetical protein